MEGGRQKERINSSGALVPHYPGRALSPWQCGRKRTAEAWWASGDTLLFVNETDGSNVQIFTNNFQPMKLSRRFHTYQHHQYTIGQEPLTLHSQESERGRTLNRNNRSQRGGEHWSPGTTDHREEENTREQEQQTTARRRTLEEQQSTEKELRFLK